VVPSGHCAVTHAGNHETTLHTTADSLRIKTIGRNGNSSEACHNSSLQLRGLDCRPNSISRSKTSACPCGMLVGSYKCSILKDARFQDEDARTSRNFGSYASATHHGCLIRRSASVAGPFYPYLQTWSAQCAWFRYPTLIAKQYPAISKVSLLRAFHIRHVSDLESQQVSKWLLCV
jgi:hypothetical protein